MVELEVVEVVRGGGCVPGSLLRKPPLGPGIVVLSRRAIKKMKNRNSIARREMQIVMPMSAFVYRRL